MPIWLARYPLATASHSPGPPPVTVSVSLWYWGKGIQGQTWSWLIERFQSSSMLCFTIPCQKEEFSSLGGTVELNSPGKGCEVGLWWSVLSVHATNRNNWFNCEWRDSRTKEVFCLADGPLLVLKSGMIVTLLPPHETRLGKFSLYSLHAPSIIQESLYLCLPCYTTQPNMMMWPEVKWRMFACIQPTLR